MWQFYTGRSCKRITSWSARKFADKLRWDARRKRIIRFSFLFSHIFAYAGLWVFQGKHLTKFWQKICRRSQMGFVTVIVGQAKYRRLFPKHRLLANPRNHFWGEEKVWNALLQKRGQIIKCTTADWNQNPRLQWPPARSPAKLQTSNFTSFTQSFVDKSLYSSGVNLEPIPFLPWVETVKFCLR